MSQCWAEGFETVRSELGGIDSRGAVDAFAFRMLLGTLVGWLDQRQQDAIACLAEENRILREYVRVRIRFTGRGTPPVGDARAPIGPSPPA